MTTSTPTQDVKGALIAHPGTRKVIPAIVWSDDSGNSYTVQVVQSALTKEEIDSLQGHPLRFGLGKPYVWLQRPNPAFDEMLDKIKDVIRQRNTSEVYLSLPYFRQFLAQMDEMAMRLRLDECHMVITYKPGHKVGRMYREFQIEGKQVVATGDGKGWYMTDDYAVYDYDEVRIG